MLQTLEYDVKRAPLGALQATTLKAGAAKLKEIEDLLATPSPSKQKLEQLSSQYYTLIPHSFGMKAPPTIKDSKTISKVTALLLFASCV
jgi:poly [ADP-ribose] polymerase